MAKVTFEFDSLEDKDDLEVFSHAKELYSAVHEVRHIIRGELKHNDKLSDESAALLERIRDLLTIQCDI